MNTNKHSILRALIALLTGFLISTGAWAQSSDSSNDSGEDYLEEIMVTAQKRSENVQDVPIAITVFSDTELDKLGIVDLNGISQRTPGFSMGSKDAASSQMSIRGIGSTDDGAGADNSVIVYVDEVPIGRAAGMEIDLFDLERVEVLRGPQGTLFGRNAVGGALSLVTTKPTEDLKIKLEAKAGKFNQQDFRALVSGPIAENVFGKISFSNRKRDGYLDSSIDELPNFETLFPNLSLANARDIRALDIDRTSMRAALRFTPSDQLEINWSASVSNLDQTNAQRVFIGDRQQFGGFAGDALFPGRRNDYTSEFFEDPGFDIIDTFASTLRVDYTMANDFLLTSISSTRELETVSNDVTSTMGQATAILQTGAGLTAGGDVRNVIIAPVSIPFFENSDTFTQEFRITSPGDGRLRWVAGAFFMKEDVHRDERVILGLAIRDPLTNDVSVLAPPGESGDNQIVSVDSVAVFGEATFVISDTLEATLGLRYTEDEKDITRTGTADGIVVANPFFVENSASFDEVTGRAALAWKPTDDILLFGSFSTGFKSGGFQGRGTSEASVRDPFGPETAETTELGLKSTFLDGRLTFNPTIFHTKFDDLQVVELLRPVNSPPGTTASLVTQNAANAEIDGVELEYSWYPVDGLTIRGAYTWLDAEFIEFFAPPGFESTAGAALTDRAGNKLLKSPEYSISQLVRYEWPVEAWGGHLVAQGEFIHKEEQMSSVDNAPTTTLPAYDVANFSLTYVREGDHTAEFSIWVDNAFDESYLLPAFAQGGGGRALAAPPRTAGVTFRWHY